MALHHELATSKPLLLDDLKNVLVLGAGNFGTCLAVHLANLSHEVTIYARDAAVVKSINEEHVNSKYMKSIKLPSNLKATNKLNKEAIDHNHVLLFAIPTEHLRDTLTLLKPVLHADHLLILANKGIEIQSLAPPFTIVEEVLSKAVADRVVFLSGPSFAAEVVDRQPTMVVAASKTASAASYAQQVFHSPQFRVYTSDDPIGVEIAGALKNVIAIGSGLSSGLGFQMNTRAGLITRGLAEMTRVGVAMGANPLTFMGLAGYRLGKGESLASVLATLGSTAEGITTLKAAYLLSKKLKTDTPIVDHLRSLSSFDAVLTLASYGILYENRPIREAVESLLRRVASPDAP